MSDGGVKGWIGEAACSCALTLAGIGFALSARGMDWFEDGVPGPGMAPMMLGVALAILGIGIGATAILQRVETRVAVLERETVLAVLLLATAVASFESAGYVLSTFLFLLASFTSIGRARLLPAVLVAGGATLVTWLLFVKALGVPLPAGLMTFI